MPLNTNSANYGYSHLVYVCVCSVVSNVLRPHGLGPTMLLCPWTSSGKNTGVGFHFLLQGNLPNSVLKPRSPAMQADSLPSEPQGKPKNTGVGSLSLSQGIFLTQESNGDLLNCRWIGCLNRGEIYGTVVCCVRCLPAGDAIHATSVGCLQCLWRLTWTSVSFLSFQERDEAKTTH